MISIRVMGTAGLVIALWASVPVLAQKSKTNAKVVSLADSLAPLQSKFNADQQELRFLAVFSPS